MRSTLSVRTAAFGLAAVLAATGRAPASGDAAALLAQHAAFTGWVLTDGSVPSLVLDGTRRDAKGTVTARVHELRLGRLSRRAYFNVRSGASREVGFTGRLYWSSDENGFTIPTIGRRAAFETSYDLLFDEATPLIAGAKVTGTATIGGAALEVVHLEPQGGLPMDLYVDPATGAYARAKIGDTTLDILAYAEARPGKKIISSWRVDGDSGEWTYDKIDAAASVAPEDVHPPAARASWSFGSDQPYPIALDTTERRRIFVDASVNGVIGHFVLDTGADGIFVTSEFARRAGAEKVGTTTVEGIGANPFVAATAVKFASVAFGSNVLHDVAAIADVETDSVTGDRRGSDGLIGFPLFAAADVKLDLDKQLMTIEPPGTFDLDKIGGLTFVADLSGGQIVLPAKLDGKAEVDAMLDTGTPLWVLVSSTTLYARSVPLFHDASKSVAEIEVYGGGSGAISASCGELASIDFGPVHYAPAPACESAAWDPSEPVLVGLDFLKNFNFYFDYPDSRVVLVPRS